MCKRWNGWLGPGPRGGRQYPAVRQALDLTPPRFRTLSLRDSALPDDLVARAQVLAADLKDSYLAVQGPPGPGTTVGITGPRHKAIGNLLLAVGARVPAGRLAGVQRAAADQAVAMPGITVCRQNGGVARALTSHRANLAAGPAGLFANHDMHQSLDHLVIDEAAQVPLAFAVAAVTAAHNLILVGDPQQLQQLVLTVHPTDTDRSVLGHIMGTGAVMAHNLGLFMAVTRRMHPRISIFISQLAYEGRVRTLPELERQHVRVAGDKVAGLWYVPVAGPGVNFNASREEARAVKALATVLLEGEGVDAAGSRRPLTPARIVVSTSFRDRRRRW